MNKKLKPEEQKKFSIYKLIDDYSNSILKYEKSLIDGERFSQKQITQQREFLKILYQKLQKYSKDKGSKKHFSQLKHIQFILAQSEDKIQRKEQNGSSPNDSLSIQLKKQAMIIQQQNEQIQRLTRYSSTTSLLTQSEKNKSSVSFQSQNLSKRTISEQYQEQIQSMRDTLSVIRKENKQLKDTNRMLIDKLNNTNTKLNLLLSRCGSLQNSKCDDKIGLSFKKLTIDTDRSIEFEPQIKQFERKGSNLQDELLMLKIQNQNFQRKINELCEELNTSKKQCNVFKQRYLRTKHNITRNDSSQDIMKDKKPFLKKQQSVDKLKKVSMLNDLKSLVANHRKSIPQRHQQFD